MTPTAETQHDETTEIQSEVRIILQAAQTEAFQMSSSPADVILVSHACLRGRPVVILAWQQLIFLTLQYMCIYEVVCVWLSSCDHSCTGTNWQLFLTVKATDELASLPHLWGWTRQTRQTHRVFPAPSSTITEDDKYSSVPKNQRCGTFAADWLGCDLHNA